MAKQTAHQDLKIETKSQFSDYKTQPGKYLGEKVVVLEKNDKLSDPIRHGHGVCDWQDGTRYEG